MGAKNYKHIAIEGLIAEEFSDMKNTLRKFKKKPTDTETMKVLLEKNQRIKLPKEDILKILLDPQDE